MIRECIRITDHQFRILLFYYKRSELIQMIMDNLIENDFGYVWEHISEQDSKEIETLYQREKHLFDSIYKFKNLIYE